MTKEKINKKILQVVNLSPSEDWIEKVIYVHPMKQITIASIDISVNKIIVTPSNEQITDVSAVQVTYSRNIGIVSQRVVSIIGVELGSFTKKGDEEDDTASQFVSASLVGNVFILAMNEKMADKDYDKANFDLKKSGVRLDIASIVIDNNLVKITPSGETITDLSSVKFEYTPGGNYNKNLVDIVGNSMASFIYLGDPNPNAPAMQTIALDDGNIKITFDKTVVNKTTYNNNNFTVISNGKNLSVIDIVSNGLDVVLDISGTISNINTATIIYEPTDIVADNLVDLIGNEVVEFSKEAVASIETMGVSPAQINSKISNLFTDVPKQETYVLTDATQGVKEPLSGEEDTNEKKSKRTKNFIKSMLNKISSVDVEYDPRAGKLIVSKELLAFPAEVEQYVEKTVRIYGEGSDINTDVLETAINGRYNNELVDLTELI